MKKSVLFSLVILLGVFACRKVDVSLLHSNEIVDQTLAEGEILMSSTSTFGIFSYNDNPFTFQDVSIQDDTITIRISYGGGCGSIGKCLVAGPEIMESNPPQRNLKLFFTDFDDCEAYLTIEWSFDIIPLRVDGVNSVILHLEGWDTPLVYEY